MSAFRNQRLFSDHYLQEILPQSDEWKSIDKEKLNEAFARIQSLHQKKCKIIPSLKESQLEEEFIRPILRILGHIYAPHPSSEAWRGFICRLSDFTDATPDINKYRFCSYIPYDEEACRKCIDSCPSGAQTNSTPTAYGSYPEKIKNQTHRFWEGKLQFDFARCCEERGQMATLFPEWSCARCISICVAAGKRRINATKNFYKEMLRLTKELK